MSAAPSPAPFFEACWPALATASAATGRGLADLACGRGRHALAAASRGVRTVGIDRDAEALRVLAAAGRGLPLSALRADLEGAPAPPLRPASCGALVVFRYLHRPLAPALVELLAPGGVLVYETFTRHQRDLPHGPRNPAFLLEPGELPRLFPRLRVLHFEEELTPGPRPEALARLLAQHPG